MSHFKGLAYPTGENLRRRCQTVTTLAGHESLSHTIADTNRRLQKLYKNKNIQITQIEGLLFCDQNSIGGSCGYLAVGQNAH